ncbi:IS30 family transposase [bacterium]|nr:IS30 family transposase [bacterium]
MQYTQLTEGERNQIYALMQAKKRIREIAELLRRCPSTISREIKRNHGLRGYRPKQAHRKAMERRQTPRTRKMTHRIKEHIERQLKQEWSPEQISATMENEIGVRISHERIYQHIWDDKQDGGVLYQILRIAGKKRKRKKRGSKDWRGKIPNRIDIDQRPRLVDRKKRVGDWEADLVSGAHHKGFLVTLVERKHKYTLIGHVTNKTALAVQDEIIRLLSPIQSRVHTITFDNGHEFSRHETISQKLECQCYFAKPYHSWERGLNENTNGLIRQYCPKKSDLRNISQVKLTTIMDRLNSRPRKTLGYKTPNELFWKHNSAITTVALRT